MTATPEPRGMFVAKASASEMPLDARRKLVLLRRDATEHLVLLGAGQDLLLEAGIAAPETPGPGEAPAGERMGEPA